MAAEEAACPRSVKELGSVLQRKRLSDLANLCCSLHPGDLIEIGVLAGATSVLLAEQARAYGRRLVCIDNWPTHNNPYELDKVRLIFLEEMKKWSDVVDIWEMDAHSEECLKMIGDRQYCFAFSDDGHLFDEHYKELMALMPVTNGLIAVDDVYLPEPRQAIAAAIKANPDWVELYDPRLRESWLVKP